MFLAIIIRSPKLDEFILNKYDMELPEMLIEGSWAEKRQLGASKVTAEDLRSAKDAKREAGVSEEKLSTAITFYLRGVL